MKIADITGVLEKIAPPELADESDRGRIGLIRDWDNEINKIATALNVIDHVLQEAVWTGADLLVVYQSYQTPFELVIETPKKVRNIERTPCMAEGITNHPGTWREFLMFEGGS